MLARITTVFSFLLIGIFFVTNCLAASFSQVAYNLEIQNNEGQAGEIVVSKNGSYSVSASEYDSGIFGVIVEEAPLILNQESETTKIVVTNGEALVKVSATNGNIKAGDLVTTSKEKGIAQKATKSGHVLGKALMDFPLEGESPQEGVIPVLIAVNFNQFSSQSEQLSEAGINQVVNKVSGALIAGDLPNLIKYIFALLLGSISFLVGFSHFVRSNRTAVDAIARNPMAKAEIRKQLLLGTIGIVSVSALGLIIAVVILVFL